MSQCALHNTTGCGISEMTIGLARRVTAFDELLAVAKAAAADLDEASVVWAPLCEAISALDAAHPGWREWSDGD